MSDPDLESQMGLSREDKKDLLKRMMERRRTGGQDESEIPESSFLFEQFPAYQRIQIERAFARQAGLENPFFTVHEGVPSDTIRVNERELVNFSTYNYLGLNGHPHVTDTAMEAARRSGTSASASRIVSGECPQHRELERGLAEFLGTEDCVVFVSGHTTNVSTISALMGPQDLVLHDRLIHNSILQGALASGAKRLAFPHNNTEALDAMLKERRHLYEKVLIVTEGIYSMDGDMAPVPDLVEIKNRHKAILMVDEAHSLGVVGETGRGVIEHFHLASSEVDIHMGTLSKALAGCGGYIAGSAALVELLKYTGSGFVYSVGMPPPMAAASKAALDMLGAEPERVRKLKENGRHFLETAQALGLNTGLSQGYNIVPIIVGSSIASVRLSNALLEDGINVQPIYYPAVEEGGARLRFFLSSEHSFAQIDSALARTAERLAAITSDLS